MFLGYRPLGFIFRSRANFRLIRRIHHIRMDGNKQLPIHLHERSVAELSNLYTVLKEGIYTKEFKYNDVSQDVFVNNEVNLKHIHSFGFDYDYTLAIYSDELHNTIYEMAMENLIDILGYPKEIQGYKYNNSFPIRGLHFDTANGFLMKIDSCSRVQMGTVYKGLEKVSDEDVIEQYGGTFINVDLISSGTKRARIFQQMDLFAMAFLSLLSNVIDYFMKKNILFDPWYIFHDIENAVRLAHLSGKMHQAIINDLDRYLPRQDNLDVYMNRLLESNKTLFLITNSSYDFINKGMTHLFNADWRDLFQVVIVNARKPQFFSDGDRPFRNINIEKAMYLWDHVEEFEKHGVYGEGNVHLFNKYRRCPEEGSSVIYFGDHVYSDLMDPVLKIGWKTGAIIPELENEIKIFNSQQYVCDIEWLITIEHLITVLQVKAGGSDETEKLEKWKEERRKLRKNLKVLSNPFFGSMFRTHQNPSSFSRNFCRYADIYTSSLDNLLKYNDNFDFLPGRSLLPHERF